MPLLGARLKIRQALLSQLAPRVLRQHLLHRLLLEGIDPADLQIGRRGPIETEPEAREVCLCAELNRKNLLRRQIKRRTSEVAFAPLDRALEAVARRQPPKKADVALGLKNGGDALLRANDGVLHLIA